MFGKLFSKVGGAVKGAIQGGVSAVIGSQIDRRVTGQMQRDQLKMYKDEGATIQEILGAGGASGGSSGASTVIGNNMSQVRAQEQQQEFERIEREKDRLVQLRAQDMGLQQAQTSANATLGAATLAYKANIGRLNLDRDRFTNIELPQGLQQIAWESPENRWRVLQAQMGPDNVITTAVTEAFGVNLADPRAIQNMSQDQFQELIKFIYGMQSNAFGEASGASMAIGNAASGFGAAISPDYSNAPESRGRSR